MASRSQRASIAAETVTIAQGGRYLAPSGADVTIVDAVQMAVHTTQLITPGQARSLRSRAETILSQRSAFQTTFETRNESTFSAARRLVERYGPECVAALNFASAKNPGGGFLNGSQAQEESLSRSSALYSSLLRAWEFYERHRASPSLLYSDAMIWSPDCPIFRQDDGTLLDEPQSVGFITSPAPNAGAAAQNRPEELAQIPEVFRRRSEYVLAL